MKAGTVVLFTLFLLVLAGPPVECGDTSSRPNWQDYRHWQPKDWQHWQPKELKQERERELTKLLTKQQERYWQLKEQRGRLERLGLVELVEANQKEQQKLLKVEVVLEAKPMPITMPKLTTKQVMHLRKDEAKLVLKLAQLAKVATNAKQLEAKQLEAKQLKAMKRKAKQLKAMEDPMEELEPKLEPIEAKLEAKQQAKQLKLQELELLQLLLVLRPSKLEAGWPERRKLARQLTQLELEGSQLKLTQELALKGVEEKSPRTQTLAQTLALAQTQTQTQTQTSGSRHKTIILGLSTLTIFSGLALLIFWILEKQRESSQTNIKG